MNILEIVENLKDKNKEEMISYLKNLKKELSINEDDNCCFCSQPLHKHGNDIRPLISTKGDRCCDECNLQIVLPNRMKFWSCTSFYCIYDIKQGQYIGELDSLCSLLGARKFKDEEQCVRYITTYGTPDWKLRRMIIREDN